MKQYQSPTGTKIIGTSDIVPGTALIIGIEDDGSPSYSGETDMDWDGQKTNARDGKILFVDENYELWTFDQLSVLEEEEEEDD